MTVPDPTMPFPVAPGDRRCVFVRPTVRTELLEVGEFTYYDASEDQGSFEDDRMLYAYGPERLIIGRFCAIGPRSHFLLGGNHVTVGPTTYPFTMFPGAWQDATLATFLEHNPSRGDTVVGNDVWIGRDVTVLPGVTVGDGAIIGTGAVVTRNVDPYTVVAGNPGREVGRRYSPEDAGRLQTAAWWDWPVECITEHAATLMAGSVSDIVRIADALRAEPPGRDQS